MEENKREKLLNKITNLLKLSENNSNENEAQSALLKAQEIMAKYNIEQQELGIKEENKKIMKKKIIENKGRIMWYEYSLASIISKNFRCTYYSSRNKGKYNASITILGLEEDVLICSYLFDFAINMLKKFGKEYIKNNSNENTNNTSLKNVYYNGFIKGLDKSFKEQVEQNNWGLVLVKDALVIQEESKLNIKSIKTSGIKPLYENNNGAFNSGFSDGYNTGKNYNSKKKLLD